MGNVAHDLKTPLHSLEADMELLILVISKIPKFAVEKAVASIQASSCTQNLDLQSIFNTMNATCKFMVSSINRSQDFMKTSNNIVLMPTLESFDLGTTMAVAVTCIKRMLSERLIVVHPFDENICPHLVSDKHWLIENMMCLLSNAIKYGDTGDVDVHIKVIGAPTYDDVLSSLKKDDHHEKEDGHHDIETRVAIQPSTQPSMQPSSQPYSRPSSQHSTHRGVTHKRGSAYDTYPKENDMKKPKPMVLITVEDSGIGISEEGRKDLFQHFKTAQRMAGGTGLGLYSLLKRVEALGGEVLI
jgi:signal transduction histidine kinase